MWRREEASRKMADIDDQLGHLQITLSFQAKNALHANAVNQTTQAELRDAHSQVTPIPLTHLALSGPPHPYIALSGPPSSLNHT